MPKLDHIAIEVSDTDAAIAFYRDRLGFKLLSRAVNEAEHEEYSFMESDGTRLELLRDRKKVNRVVPPPAPPYCPHICFQTNDMQRTLSELQARGIPILRGPLEVPGEETWVYFTDPDNNVLEYIQWLK